ncbi:MAG TPA: hypothetical protein VEA15_11225 [Caulobacteraceae bacterium]|nr:hypothetical protein [Caulobacteraceae bacterium]
MSGAIGVAEFFAPENLVRIVGAVEAPDRHERRLGTWGSAPSSLHTEGKRGRERSSKENAYGADAFGAAPRQPIALERVKKRHPWRRRPGL